ncbi:MAG: hypothetical protein IH831_00705 [Planctomycetes bacterium]|nr:hypothetical protein [Planctomycetota bacterium]
MSAKQLVSSLGKLALFASVASVSLLTTTSSASPIAPGFDLFTSNDALGNSLIADSCSPIGSGKHGRCDEWQ